MSKPKPPGVGGGPRPGPPGVGGGPRKKHKPVPPGVGGGPRPHHPAPPGVGGGPRPGVGGGPRKKRGLARSATEVACCAAEALAASLRLAGGSVSDEDVLALFWLAGGDAGAGVSIWAALEAAAEHGLAGIRPVSWRSDEKLGSVHSGVASHARLGDEAGHLILGVDLPGPHALYDDGTAWWSWGEPFDPADFAGAVIEEAWEVRWAA